MKNTNKRLLSLLLVLVLILGILPVTTLAADTNATITSGTPVGDWEYNRVGSASIGPDKTYDNDLSTYWNPQAYDKTYAKGEGIVYELDNEYDVSKISITYLRKAYFQVLVSNDGSNYDLYADVTATSEAMYLTTVDTDTFTYNFAFNAANIQYVKILFTGNAAGNQWISLKEIEIQGSASSQADTDIVRAETVGNWTTTQPSTSLSIFSSYDNSTSTRWNPGAGGFAEDLGVIYTLRNASHVEKMEFLFSTDTADTSKYYINVFVSSDGSAYTPVAKVTADKEAQAYPDGTALCVLDGLDLDDVKYVKVIFAGRKSSTVAWVSLYDVNISSEGTDGADTSWMLPFFSGVEMLGPWDTNTANIGYTIDGNEATMWNPCATSGWSSAPGIEFTLTKATDLQKLQFNFGTKSDGTCTYYFDLYAKKEGGEYTKVAAISPVNEANAYKAIGSYYYCVLDGLALEDVTAVKLIFNGRKSGGSWLSLYEATFSETGTSGLNTAWMLPPVSKVELVGSWSSNQAGTTISVEQTIDGNTSTYWNPDALYSSAPGVVYTLTEAMDLNKLQFNFGSGNHYFDVYVSADGSDYTKIAEISAYNEAQAYTTSGDRYICTLDGLDLQDVQYVKVIFTGRNTGSTWLKVHEVTFSESGASDLDNSWILPAYGNVGIASASLGGTWATENTTALGNAYDGNVSTKWNSCATYSGTPSVVFTLDKYYNLSNVSIALSSRYSYMDVAVSGNGTTYTSVASVTAENYTEYYKNGYICTIDGLEEGNVKYIKVTFTGDSANNFSWMNFHEIGAMGTVSQVQEFICYHKNQTTTTEDATCKAEGSVTVTCDDCGETLSTKTLPVADHAWTDATCAAPKTCSACGETEGDVLDHADENNDGACDACSASLVKTDENMKFYRSNTSGGDLMLGDDIRGSFIVNVKNLDYDEIYLEITMAGATSKAYKTANSTSTYAYFAYVVPAPRMTENITLTIYGVKDGVEYRGETLNWTIRAAVDGKLAAWFPNYETNEAMALRCDLLVSMLYYGEKAQEQFKINLDKLATAGLAPEYAALIKTEMPAVNSYPAVDETGKSATLSTMSLMLQEKVKMAGNFKVTSGFTAAEDYHIEIQHTKSKDGTVVNYTINSDAFTVTGSSTKYIQFTFDKLAGAQLRDDLKITLYQNGEPVSLTYTRSAEMVADTYQTRLPALIAAIMNYADCAKAVFG